MFGRRRHAAQAAPTVAVSAAAAPLPRLAEEQVFELVHSRIAAAIGESGEWVVRRRTEEDTDELFRAVLAHQVAVEVTAALRDAQLRLDAGEMPEPITAPSAEIADVDAPNAMLQPSEVQPSEVQPTEQRMPEDATAQAEETDVTVETQALQASEVVATAEDRAPSHRHDEQSGDEDAVLDEESLALQWEPAPITTWTDLKWPVTEPIATITPRQQVVREH